VDEIQCLIDKTFAVGLNTSSLDITWFTLSAPSSKALKKSTLGR
jgi:hypothetical protein